MDYLDELTFQSGMIEIHIAAIRHTIDKLPTYRPVSADRTNSRNILHDSLHLAVIGKSFGEFSREKYGTAGGLLFERCRLLGRSTVNRVEIPGFPQENRLSIRSNLGHFNLHRPWPAWHRPKSQPFASRDRIEPVAGSRHGPQGCQIVHGRCRIVRARNRRIGNENARVPLCMPRIAHHARPNKQSVTLSVHRKIHQSEVRRPPAASEPA